MKDCELTYNLPFNDCHDLPDNHCLCMRNEGVPEGNLDFLRTTFENYPTAFLKTTMELFGPGKNYDGWCKASQRIYSIALSIYKNRLDQG